MARSFKAPKQYVKHSYHPNSPVRKVSPKKGGAGRFGWGTDKDYIDLVMTNGIVEPKGIIGMEKVTIAQVPMSEN